jgi:hypothetical protein
MESNDQETENTKKLKIMNHRARNKREDNRENQNVNITKNLKEKI